MSGQSDSGHVYMQTNEDRNRIIHYLRASNGQISEVQRHLTAGAGSGQFGYLSSPPEGLIVEGAQSVVLSTDRRFLFAVNCGDNSVSSFKMNDDGSLALVDVKRTGNLVGARGTAKSLAFSSMTRSLYVLHTFGPKQIRMMSVDDDGYLIPRPEAYAAVPPEKPNRITTMLVLSPDQRFLLVGSSMDEIPTTNPDGSAIVWVQRDGRPHSIAANNPDPDGLAVFPIQDSGTLGDPMFQDSGTRSPWCPLFLNLRPDHFVLGYAAADGLALASIDSNGGVTTGPVVPADTSMGRPSELCWMAITPDDRLIFATMTGYSYITSWRLDGNVLTIARDPACEKVPGDGTFRGFAGIVGSGPNDMWITPDGNYLYQIYGNASKLVGYAIQEDGWLEEITSATIPRNSPQGLTGF
jgi:hypothetical protein